MTTSHTKLTTVGTNVKPESFFVPLLVLKSVLIEQKSVSAAVFHDVGGGEPKTSKDIDSAHQKQI